ITSLKNDLTGERAKREKQMEEFHLSREVDRAEIARLTSDIEQAKQEMQDSSNTGEINGLSRKIQELQDEINRKKSRFWYKVADFFDNLF
ncbi:hypothetical protein FRC06_010313, partial [Ceratobasidium sp. 370]